MCFNIVNDVGVTSFHEHACLFRHQLKWNAEEDILLRQVGDGAHQDAADVVVATDVRDDVYVEEEVSSCNAGDGEGFRDFFWGRGWRHRVVLSRRY